MQHTKQVKKLMSKFTAALAWLSSWKGHLMGAHPPLLGGDAP